MHVHTAAFSAKLVALELSGISWPDDPTGWMILLVAGALTVWIAARGLISLSGTLEHHASKTFWLFAAGLAGVCVFAMQAVA